jgi:hypothetical protein
MDDRSPCPSASGIDVRTHTTSGNWRLSVTMVAASIGLSRTEKAETGRGERPRDLLRRPRCRQCWTALSRTRRTQDPDQMMREPNRQCGDRERRRRRATADRTTASDQIDVWHIVYSKIRVDHRCSRVETHAVSSHLVTGKPQVAGLDVRGTGSAENPLGDRCRIVNGGSLVRAEIIRDCGTGFPK